MRAHRAGVLSSNWLARRILSGDERAEYEREMVKAMDQYEKRMAPVLAGIVKKAQKEPLALP